MTGTSNMNSTAVNERVQAWLDSPRVSDTDKATIRRLQAESPEELYDCFCRDLDFGTGGIRGIMGVGTNRINEFTVAKIAYGLGQQILSMLNAAKNADSDNYSVQIAFDTRLNSYLYALICENVLWDLGIPAWCGRCPSTTPYLSSLLTNIRERNGAQHTGIMITASHNPAEYNGIKVYDNDGVQLTPKKAQVLAEWIKRSPDPLDVPFRLPKVPPMEDAYHYFEFSNHWDWLIKKESRLGNYKKDFTIVYTPLYGAGNVLVDQLLLRDRFSKVICVDEQRKPNPKFPGLKAPNPEEPEVFRRAIELAKEKNADIVLATDADGDRLGVAVLHKGEYHLLTGNQIGALLVNFVLDHAKPITKNDVLIKTIVTGDLGARIARSYGASVIETLTGFKYIGEKMVELEKSGTKRFLMGYEESFGYLVGSYAHDKDAAVAAMLICELAFAKKEYWQETLIDWLNDLYIKYGYFYDHLDTLTLTGESGQKRILSAMETLRRDAVQFLPEEARLLDYATGIDGLPKENVLKFILSDGSWLAVRPSGTEPKIKLYASIFVDNNDRHFPYYSFRGSDNTTAEAESIAKARYEKLRSALWRIAGLAE